MKSECASVMICFSERMCSCCLVSTMWRFFRIFMANVLASSFFNWTWKTNIWSENNVLFLSSPNVRLKTIIYWLCVSLIHLFSWTHTHNAVQTQIEHREQMCFDFSVNSFWAQLFFLDVLWNVWRFQKIRQMRNWSALTLHMMERIWWIWWVIRVMFRVTPAVWTSEVTFFLGANLHYDKPS